MRTLPNGFLSVDWRNPDGSANYELYMLSKEWHEKRKQVLERDANTCQVCGCSHEHMQVHHLSYKHLGDEPLDDLITICKPCHVIVSTIEQELFESDLLRFILDHKRHVELFVTRLDWACSDEVTQIILEAILENMDELPQLKNAYTTTTADYIANVIDAVRDTRNPKDILVANAKSIAGILKDGTFRRGCTFEGNLERFRQERIRRLELLFPNIDFIHEG